MYKLPSDISSYIREHFMEGYLSEVKSEKSANGHKFFKIQVIDNDVLHFLEFNEEGKLTEHKTEPIFEEDFYEGTFYGEEGL